MILFDAIKNDSGDESILVFVHGKRETPIAVLDWIALHELFKEITGNSDLLNKINKHTPETIAALKKELDDL